MSAQSDRYGTRICPETHNADCCDPTCDPVCQVLVTLARQAAESLRTVRLVLEREQFFNLIDINTEAALVRALGEDWDTWRVQPLASHSAERQV